MRTPAFRRRRRRAQRGFTLVELMVSLVMFSFAIAGVLAVAVALANGFREQRLGVGTEATVRAAMEFMGDAIRGASPGIETGKVTVMDETGCVEDAFAVAFGSGAPDELTVTFAYGSVVTSSTTAYDSTSSSIDVEDGSQFAANDYFVITDFAKAALVKITSVSTNTLNFSPATTGCVTGSWAANALVVRALRAKFFVAPIDGVPALWMDPDPDVSNTNAEPLAEGIEDLQVALGHDPAPANGVQEDLVNPDTDEWEGNASPEGVVFATDDIRAVRISLVARAIGKVTGAATFVRPALEDHAAGTADNYRRRVLTSVIEIRNIRGSQ